MKVIILAIRLILILESYKSTIRCNGVGTVKIVEKFALQTRNLSREFYIFIAAFLLR